MNWTPQDHQQFASHQILAQDATQQVKIFRRGIPKIALERAATIGDGITALKPREERKLLAYFKARQSQYSMLKFIPASGAATRMFKPLLAFLEASEKEDFSYAAFLKAQPQVATFIKEAHKFPFHSKVISLLPKGFSFNAASSVILYIKTLLTQEGLGYGEKPKALLPFHNIKGTTPLVLEEHIQEAFHYALKGGVAQLHFTVSPQHLEAFQTELKNIQTTEKFKTLGEVKITFSHQNPKTDTLVMGLDMHPIRDQKNQLVFHPAGHGALLENLAAQTADVIFIKNVDNVCGPHLFETAVHYKKVLAGKLLDVQEQLFAYARALEEAPLEAQDLAFMAAYYQNTFSVTLPEYFNEMPVAQQVTFLKERFNRPLRVCGMVENEGKTGGGPFWVKNAMGESHLQIVEASQINLKEAGQATILEGSTHFNPVDLVCGIKNYKGEILDLNVFQEANLAFISEKTRLGKRVKVLELPGLWNGSMSLWNTIFIAVPAATFTPVKSVLDLLDPGHLGEK